MSRIGRKAIAIPKGIDVSIQGKKVHIQGAKGKESLVLHDPISIEKQGDTLVLNCEDVNLRKNKALYGLNRMLVANSIIGVLTGFEKNLEIEGVGYKAKTEGKKIVLQLGFSHPVNYAIPEGIQISVDTTGTKIKVAGINKQKVGQVAADIRGFYPPEPYKGKGIRYEGEHVQRKEGKKVG